MNARKRQNLSAVPCFLGAEVSPNCPTPEAVMPGLRISSWAA
jgi:hypothetical protein